MTDYSAETSSLSWSQLTVWQKGQALAVVSLVGLVFLTLGAGLLAVVVGGLWRVGLLAGGN